VAEVSPFKYRISWRRNTTYMLTSKTYSSATDNEEGKKRLTCLHCSDSRFSMFSTSF
jgi:hypothetical protein